MGIQRGHAAVRGDPVELLLPDPDVLFLQDDEKAVVLGQGIGQLDVSPRAVLVARDEGENGADAVGLGLERIRIECRAGMLDVQLGDPIQIAEHGR